MTLYDASQVGHLMREYFQPTFEIVLVQ
jgi:hypothetical protein